MVTIDRPAGDYTPTLAEARGRFAKQYPDLPADPDDLAAFDRMIESVRAEERERIARNIEGQRIAPYRGAFLGEDDRGWNRAVEQAARIARERGSGG